MRKNNSFMSIFSFFKYFLFSAAALLYTTAYSLDLEYYVGGSLKNNFPLKFYSLGWNGDTLCYPNMSNCPKEKHKGFAWMYQLTSDWLNPGLGLHAGVRTHKNVRIELSLDGFQSIENTKTQSLGLYYLKENKNPFPKTVSFWDGARLPKPTELSDSLTKTEFQKTTEALSSTNSFSDLQVITVLLNIYADCPLKNTNFTPYFGLGAGYSFVKARITYEGKYKDSSLDSVQSADFSGSALSARLKAGLSYAVSDTISSGLEGSYTMLKGATDKLSYSKHPNQQTSESILRDIRYFALSFYFSYKI